MRIRKGLCFDDVLLTPQTSDIASRSEIDLKMMYGFSLDLPVFAAPMDTVCETEMAISIAEAGGCGVIHRYQPIHRQASMVDSVNLLGHPVFGSVGAKDFDEYMRDAELLIRHGATGILVDTANGHSIMAQDAVYNLSKNFPVFVMAGNVATPDGFISLSEAGADLIRVGIGGGAACTTRSVTGHGVPTLQSIIDIAEIRDSSGVMSAIIADGGIRNSGDMIKAFAAGADFVMVGSMLAGTDESPGLVTNGKKQFRGMASLDAQESRGNVSVVEGASGYVDYKGSVTDILNQIRDGLSSGCSYSGVRNLSKLYDVASFIEISSNSVAENRPHAFK